ncbi:hypothetical protein HLI_20465 [Halobacillus litoralis]|uniref:Uncharacterized protein n=1 Tax=Halobacillus litoralis TaxID=45668 RepID=A0A410MI90_9BACI|nr:hypothetical protein HLI_20455 [Halobacillus litoralis]QAS54421.1 hypothetical protein HLI_20465 [Halobacillus litoralis]
MSHQNKEAELNDKNVLLGFFIWGITQKVAVVIRYPGRSYESTGAVSLIQLHRNIVLFLS